LAIFNGVTTWVEGITSGTQLHPHRCRHQGALMLVGGILGAVVLPAISDKQQKRSAFYTSGSPGHSGLAGDHLCDQFCG
jgi:hypothetical protein